MKNLVFFGALALFLASCTNVSFVNPQPNFLEPLTEIPEKYHGIYEFEDSTINMDSYLVTDSSIGDMVLGDNLIVKQRGNYFFLNFFLIFFPAAFISAIRLLGPTSFLSTP